MSKIARVKFIRDKEPNIKALTAKNKVLDGALYVATDTGTLWMGISSSSLIQIKDNINTNTTYNLTKSGSTITLRGSDGSTFNVTDSNTVYGNATTSAAGLMSAADKTKLDSVVAGSNHVTVDAELSSTSTNPVQNKVIKSALDGKSNSSHTHDDRYYTESEINTKLAAKANSSHTHTKAQITDFPTSMPASDVSAWAKAASKPSYTIGEVSGNLPASRISGTIAAANLPSYVDDVLEGYLNGGKFYSTKDSSGAYSGEIKAEAGKIYVDLSNNKTYRWSGSAYVVISETIALGTTHSTAGYGDESRAAYNHSTETSGNPHHVTKADVGLGSVENKSSATIRSEITKANVTTALGYTPPTTDTNTHYTTRIVAGAASGTVNADTTNGNTHINVTDDNVFRSGVVIKGTGATSVTSDASGNITINSTDKDTWRPIQNNLTSTATDQSLSAAQGKALNDKFGSYVPTSRTINGNALNANITLSAANVGAAPASHSHNYAGADSAGGAANAVKSYGNAITNALRPIWFSEVGNDTHRVHNDNFKYNPEGNVVTCNISGTASNANVLNRKEFYQEKSTDGTMYYQLGSIKCTSSYQRVNETYLCVSRQNACIMNLSVYSSNDTIFINPTVSYTFLTPNAKVAFCDIFYAGLDKKATAGNTFSIWAKRGQWSESMQLIPLGSNYDKGYVISWKNWDATTAGNTSAPAFGESAAYKFIVTPHSHAKSEVGLGNVDNTADSAKSVKYATSAGSVAWSNVSGRPSIPSVGNGTITITQNGANKGSFTLNQSGNATIALTDNNTVYSLPAATSSTLGGVKVGSNITNSSGTISLTKANVTEALGYTPPTSDTNTWRPEEVIISSTKPTVDTCKIWIQPVSGSCKVWIKI